MVVEFELGGIESAAATLLQHASEKKVFAFHGAMGAGKTTFIHAICNVLKVEDVVGSPTFSIINEYRTQTGKVIFHLDLYRLKDSAEAIGAGVEDCLYSGNMCMVEWPEKAENILPPDTLHCYLTPLNSNERKLQINL